MNSVTREARTAAESRGQTAIGAGWEGQVRALFVVADSVKPTSAEAVASLEELGLRPVLLTGDNETTARAVAAEVGIDEVIAEIAQSTLTERGATRADDKLSESSMEDRKKEGYF